MGVIRFISPDTGFRSFDSLNNRTNWGSSKSVLDWFQTSVSTNSVTKLTRYCAKVTCKYVFGNNFAWLPRYVDFVLRSIFYVLSLVVG